MNYRSEQYRANCPLCDSTEIVKLVSWGKLCVQSCKACHNAWTDPPPRIIPYEDEDFHGQFPFRELSDLPRQWRKGLEMQVDLVTRFTSPGSTVLEIGCGRGLLLAEIGKRSRHVMGIEPSTSAGNYARARGLNVTTGKFPDPEVERRFDMVIASHVLEHMEDPEKMLAQITGICNPEYLLLVQANWKGLVPKVKGRRWYAWVPDQHYWHFSVSGLEWLLSKNGYEVVIFQYSSLEHGSGIISRIGEMLPGGGDQFHIVARRKSDRQT